MKIGEAYYKTNQDIKALQYFKKAKAAIEPNQDYLIALYVQYLINMF